MKLNKDGTSYCFYCKKSLPTSHFKEEVISNGKIYYRCSISEQKKIEIKNIKLNKKKCRYCKNYFNLEHFEIIKTNSGNIYHICKEKIKKQGYIYRKGAKKGQGKKIFEYKEGSYSKEYKKFKKIEGNYNLKKLEYLKIEKEQNYSCAICNKHKNELKRGLFVDHCHITNKVRGLLCPNCNILLGKFKDNTQLINESIKYLKNAKS